MKRKENIQRRKREGVGGERDGEGRERKEGRWGGGQTTRTATVSPCTPAEVSLALSPHVPLASIKQTNKKAGGEQNASDFPLREGGTTLSKRNENLQRELVSRPEIWEGQHIYILAISLDLQSDFERGVG